MVQKKSGVYQFCYLLSRGIVTWTKYDDWLQLLTRLLYDGHRRHFCRYTIISVAVSACYSVSILKQRLHLRTSSIPMILCSARCNTLIRRLNALTSFAILITDLALEAQELNKKWNSETTITFQYSLFNIVYDYITCCHAASVGVLPIYDELDPLMWCYWLITRSKTNPQKNAI